MDVCRAFTMAMLILQNVCDITGRSDEPGSRKRNYVKRVTDSSCGITREVREELFFLYDGAFFDEPCLITMVNSNPSPFSRTCIKLDDVYTYENNFDCRDILIFSFGNSPQYSTNFMSCSDIRQEVCGIEKVLYALFSSQETSHSNKTFQIKISTTEHSDKRDDLILREANSPPKALASRSSWSSWQSQTESFEERKNKEKSKGIVIIVSIVGGCLTLTCIVFCCYLGCSRSSDAEGTNGQAGQRYTAVSNNQTYGAPLMSAGNLGDTSTVSATGSNAECYHLTAADTIRGIESHGLPSAPPEENPEKTPDAPPPSYSSLFPPK